MKIGNRLLREREERKLNQSDMADLLDVSVPTYSRLERNETSIDIEQVIKFAKKLEIPVQEFLPETLTISNSGTQTHNGQGLVLGNIYNYNYSDRELAQENQSLKDKVSYLEEQVRKLEEIIEELKKHQ